MHHQRRRSPARRYLVVLMLATGCDYELSFGRLVDLDDAGPALDDGASPTDSAVPLDAAVPDAGPSEASLPVAFSCTQRGPLYPVSDAFPASCPRAPGFRYALCSCNDVQNAEVGLFADVFDSRKGPYDAGASMRTASIGAHGDFITKAGAELSGSLLTGGSAQINGGDLIVGGDLWTQADLGGTSGARVGGNARLGGNVYVGSLTVGGELLVRETVQVTTDAGTFQRAPFTFPPPCDCRDVVDRASLIERARTDNDNAAIELDARTGLDSTNAPVTRALPCGRFYVESISAGRSIALRITGRVALHVREAIYVDSGASLTITVDSGAELDVFVGGGITAKGSVFIGPTEAASRVRLHFGRHQLLFEQGGRVAAAIHAPTSYLLTEAPFELYGAALVDRAVSTGGALRLHYDLALSDSCIERFCARDSDCAAPLRCEASRCVR